MRSLVFFIYLMAVTGCGQSPGPVVLAPADYDPESMTQAAMKEFDRDGNGMIEGAELDACPALKAAGGGIDTNRDKKISTDELRARFEADKATNAGSVAVPVTLTLDRVPLADATVTFVPEACMGGKTKEATGKSGTDGMVRSFTVDGKECLGLQPGLYRIKVSKADTNGKELVPARYNTQTPLGAEVFGARGGGAVTLSLTSR